MSCLNKEMCGFLLGLNEAQLGIYLRIFCGLYLVGPNSPTKFY